MPQQGTSIDGTSNFAYDYYLLNQTIAFEALSLSLGGSYSSAMLRNAITSITGITGSGTFNIIKEWKGTLDVSYSNRSDGGNKLVNEVELRAEKNTYQPGVTSDQGYDQLRFRLMVVSKW